VIDAVSEFDPTASVTVPVEVAWFVQPALLLVVYEKLLVTLTPLSTIDRELELRAACPHQSIVIDWPGVVKVPPAGVMVTVGGGQLPLQMLYGVASPTCGLVTVSF
jgi:hypothetical protein